VAIVNVNVNDKNIGLYSVNFFNIVEVDKPKISENTQRIKEKSKKYFFLMLRTVQS